MKGRKTFIKLEHVIHIIYVFLQTVIHGNYLANLKPDIIIQMYPI